MKKKADGRLRKKASYLALALIMAAGLSACGSGKEPQPAAEQTVETAEAQAAEEAAKEAAEKEAAEKEAAAKEAAEKEAAAKEAAEKEAAAKEAAEKKAAEKEAAEQEAIKKPEPAAEEAADDKGKENKKKENKKEADKDNSEALALLDGKMTFDGMELEFPIELDGMKLGNWKIEYHGVDDPDSKMLAPAEIVTAVMSNDAFTADDVTASRREASFAARACSRTISSILLFMQNPSENQKRKTASTVFLIIAHRALFVNFFARRARFPFPSDKNPRRQVHTGGDYLIRKEI